MQAVDAVRRNSAGGATDVVETASIRKGSVLIDVFGTEFTFPVDSVDFLWALEKELEREPRKCRDFVSFVHVHFCSVLTSLFLGSVIHLTLLSCSLV